MTECRKCLAPLPLHAAKDGVVRCPYCGTDHRVAPPTATWTETAPRAARGNAMARAVVLALALAVLAYVARRFMSN